MTNPPGSLFGEFINNIFLLCTNIYNKKFQILYQNRKHGKRIDKQGGKLFTMV